MDETLMFEFVKERKYGGFYESPSISSLEDMKMKRFTTHTGEVVTGDRLNKALEIAAEDWAVMVKAIRDNDEYASHVTIQQKEDNFLRGLRQAEDIRAGKIIDFTAWQRVNQVLTGECISFFEIS